MEAELIEAQKELQILKISQWLKRKILMKPSLHKTMLATIWNLILKNNERHKHIKRQWTSLALDQGVVQGYSRPRSAARSGYPLEDHGGAGGAVQIRPSPGDENTHFLAAVTGGRLGTYRGQDRVGGDTLTQSPLWGAVSDVRRTPRNVAGRSNIGREIRDDNDRGGDDG